MGHRMSRQIPLLLLAVVASAPSTPAAAQACLVPQNQIVAGGPGKDGIPALTQPPAVPAAQGDAFLEPSSLVLGVVVNGEARGLSPQRPVVARDHQRRGRRRPDRGELLPAHGEWHRLRPHGERTGPQLRRLGALVRQQPDHVRPHHREPLVADAEPVDLRRVFRGGSRC